MLDIQHAAKPFVGFRVPNDDVFVNRHRNQVGMSWVEDNTLDTGRMACQRCCALLRIGVPNLDVSFLSRRCHVFVRRDKTYAMNRFGVSNVINMFFCDQIYQTNVAVQRRRHKLIYVVDVFDLRNVI